MKYIHVLQREMGSYFGSLTHMVRLVKALTTEGYLVAVIDADQIFKDTMREVLTEDEALDPTRCFYINRANEKGKIYTFWDDLKDWVLVHEHTEKSNEIYIFNFTSNEDIHDLLVHEPKGDYPVVPNLVMSKVARYPEIFRLIKRIDSYTFSKAVIKWLANGAKEDVLSMDNDRSIVEEPIVKDFRFLLRKTENEENMEGTKNGRKKKYRMGFKKTR